jgi:UDP-N-acetylmuramoylalanine--D-glutamate ligase
MKYQAIKKMDIREAFADFKGIENRMEPVKRIFGIEFVNDAKSISQNAFWFSMMEIKSPIVWITHLNEPISDKGKFSEIRKQVRHIVFIGNDARNLHREFGTEVDSITTVGTIAEAVMMANHYAVKGDIVLYSPAAKIPNVRIAGNAFKRAVNDMEK